VIYWWIEGNKTLLVWSYYMRSRESRPLSSLSLSLERKKCSVCRIPKRPKAFSKQTSRKDGLHNECKLCAKRRLLQTRYKISLSDYKGMYKKQGGQCACCEQKRTLVVDHEHKSGRVRALLCNHCNSMLGQARESVLILAQGILYLTRHRGVHDARH